MSELAQFRPGAVPRANLPFDFDFDFASLQLLATFKGRKVCSADLALHSEWRDPVALWEEQA